MSNNLQSGGEGIEELKRWIAHQDAALRLDAYRDDRHGVDFWNAYLAFRAGGCRDFPEPFLKKLDLMVRLMLKAETNEEVCDAVELRRPIGGGPSGAKKAVWSAEARRQRAVIWAEHLKLAGETYRRDAPVPLRLKRGTYEAAMKRLPGTTKSGLMNVWWRWRSKGVPDDATLGADLQGQWSSLNAAIARSTKEVPESEV